MTWEETIQFARTQPEYKDLIEQSYLEEDLILNIKRFSSSEEFSETLKLINQYSPHAKRIVDLGAGNGVSSVAWALKGYEVIAVEPDSSETVGCGAITIQKEKLNLVQLNVLKEYGEKISLADECCDVVYVRQAMHHASNLDNFMREASRILKKGGLFLGIREHVVYDAKDRLRFLESHPLQKYYGGENAYTENEYLNAINKAGLILKHVYKYFDTVINYYPVKSENLSLKIQLNKKIGRLSDYRVFQNLYKKIWELRYGKFLDERRIAGRMYSFVCVKPHKN